MASCFSEKALTLQSFYMRARTRVTYVNGEYIDFKNHNL